MIQPMPAKPPRVPERWRDIAGAVGHMPPAERNAITDVPGVLVGQSQARSGERSGVTIVAPPELPAMAGTAVVNGTGELTSKLEIDETGWMETPVYLCGTHAVGTVYQAAIVASGRGPSQVVIPVVGECDDGDLADSRTIVAEDVQAAAAGLGPEVAEGSVGAGTGMQVFEFPGGIGTASRRVGEWTVGVLLLCNFGQREYLDFLGTTLPEPERRVEDTGSCIAVCATNAPLSALQLKRLALRPLMGLARAGSYGGAGSGEIGLAFSTSRDGEVGNAAISPLFAAAYESAWEAVMNCLVAAKPAKRLDGTAQDAFPIGLARELASKR